MKKLLLVLFVLISGISYSQDQFRSGVFLTHSTGQCIWGPNGSSTSIPDEIQNYNSAKGYTGSQAVSMNRQSFPLTPWDNEWERWHRIFEHQDPEADIRPILSSNKIIVIKSCFPSSSMTGWGQASDTLNFALKSMYNYKWHWRHIIRAMAQYPDNFFAIWTNAPLNQSATNANAAMLSKKFAAWAKDTLARGLDPEIGAMPPNIYIFDYFSKLTDPDGYQMLQYAASGGDSHPNSLATELVAPQFVNEIFDAAIAYEQNNTLSVTPAMHTVSAVAGEVNFTVVSNCDWTVESNATWCEVTPSGSGNGEITATYSENTGLSQRTANITVSADGVSQQVVTVIQAGAAAILEVSPASHDVSAAAGEVNFTVVSNCDWTAQSDAPWCEVTPSGSGNGEITVTYSANTGLTPRTANITISADGVSQQVVTVIQAGAAAILEVSPVSHSVNEEAGAVKFTVVSNCNWTAQSNAPWCEVTPSGSGNGEITATYSENTGLSQRTANITVSADGVSQQVVTVIQAGAAAILEVSPASHDVSAEVGVVKFTVVSNCDWTAQSDAPWCEVTPSGSGNGEITATYNANTGLSQRTANITVSADGVSKQVVTVIQAGAAAILGASPVSHDVSAESGEVKFTVVSNCDWTAQSDAPWCKITSYENENEDGEGEITAEYEANQDETERTATITISAINSDMDITVTIRQEGKETGIKFSASDDFYVYPNPTNDQLVVTNISSADGQANWVLKDLSGRTIKSGDVIVADKTNIYIGKLSPGCYILVISSGTQIQSTPIIIN